MNENYIRDLAKQGLRLDGRKADEIRKPIKIETGLSKNAEGSAKCTIGDTEVMVGIKLGTGLPYPDNPDEGTIIVTTELLPMSNPKFESGPPREQAIELARIVDRGIRESKMIDFKKLCIRKGELVWMVFIDIYTINDAGNLIDAAALATVAALKEAKFPKIGKDDKIDYGTHTTKLPIQKEPITCTVLKVGDKLLVDPLLCEEKVMDGRLSIAIGKSGVINAMQKNGDKGFKIDEINQII